jgi:hypothetical protein
MVGPSSYLRSVLLARAVGTGREVGVGGNRGGGGVRQDIESGCGVRQEVRRAPPWGGTVRQWVWLRAAGVRREVFGCRRRGSGVRCVGLPGSAGGGGSDGRCVGLLTAEVRRAMRLAVDGEGQACSASGCRGQLAAWSDGRCVGLPAWGGWSGSGSGCGSGVRREVRQAADGGSQAGGALGCGQRGLGMRCVGLLGQRAAGVRLEVRRAVDGGGQA